MNHQANPFLLNRDAKAWGPGSFQMAPFLIKALDIRPGMRILEVGGGSGQIASVLARTWDVSVVTLEPWTDGSEIRSNADRLGVGNRVLPLKLTAQAMPFADASFDAVLSIGSFEMIGEERPAALKEMIRVARPGASIGIAEPMCRDSAMPEDLRALDREHHLGFESCFSTSGWNADLFRTCGLEVTQERHFETSSEWWLEYARTSGISEAEKELISRDAGRWLSLGMVVGRKA